MKKGTEYVSPLQGETENQKFKHPNQIVRFRGQELPAHFVITWNSGSEPKDGTIIGNTRFNEILVWEQGQVVLRQSDRR